LFLYAFIHSLNVDTEGIFCMNITLRLDNAVRRDTARILSVIAMSVGVSRFEHEDTCILGKTRGQNFDSLTEL
jgi:hypothetical protein